jgi:hypothetical protein
MLITNVSSHVPSELVRSVYFIVYVVSFRDRVGDDVGGPNFLRWNMGTHTSSFEEGGVRKVRGEVERLR